ncbi:MAG: hypothetical protein LBM27_01570 [Lactobacillaceae bacterium]|jgi:hypothetical protein|nr:hypothetical protein [Lactobacillaceae bacterium]
MKINDIDTLFVNVENSKSGKVRSVLIRRIGTEEIGFFKITSKFENKSEFMKKSICTLKTGRELA